MATTRLAQAAVLGPLYNMELEGHLDTVVLAGDGAAPSWPANALSPPRQIPPRFPVLARACLWHLVARMKRV